MKNLLVAAFSLLALIAASGPAAWLDADTPASWNVPGASIPTPLPLKCSPPLGPLPPCNTRPATEPEDRILLAHGWKLVGEVLRYGTTTVVFGASATDGMGRPEGYNGFVFVGRTFAGTLSPQIVPDSRDGVALSIYNVVLYGDTSLNATFERYDKGSSAACCPNAETSVDFTIERVGASYFVKPEGSFTKRNRS
jgi:hypothetical protein